MTDKSSQNCDLLSINTWLSCSPTEWISAISSVITAIAIVVLILQYKNSKEQVRILQEEKELTLRPWIGPIEDIDVKDNGEIWSKFKNYGRTPATIHLKVIETSNSPMSLNDILKISESRKPGPNIILLPNSEERATHTNVFDPFKKVEYTWVAILLKYKFSNIPNKEGMYIGIWKKIHILGNVEKVEELIE
ncbi:hypothetical protein [Candidatus Nitrosocosmicus sp. R]